jgi:hypothetical protein
MSISTSPKMGGQTRNYLVCSQGNGLRLVRHRERILQSIGMVIEENSLIVCHTSGKRAAVLVEAFKDSLKASPFARRPAPVLAVDSGSFQGIWT